MPTQKIRNDLIPLKAGIVRLTLLDEDGDPLYKIPYTTQRNFLTSTAVATTRASETLANGNGSDKDFPTSETYTLTLVTNIFDQKFHNYLAGSIVPSKILPILFDTTVTVPSATPFEVDLTSNPPVAMDDGNVYFEIRDAYGEQLTTPEGEAALAEGNYSYDPDTKKLTFHSSAAGKSFSCVYNVAGTGGEAFASNPILKSPQFRLEVYGEMQSANYGGTTRLYELMPRATVSGDLPNVTTQKSISAPITYTFASAPVPQGISSFYQSFTPMES